MCLAPAAMLLLYWIVFYDRDDGDLEIVPKRVETGDLRLGIRDWEGEH